MSQNNGYSGDPSKRPNRVVYDPNDPNLNPPVGNNTNRQSQSTPRPRRQTGTSDAMDLDTSPPPSTRNMTTSSSSTTTTGNARVSAANRSMGGFTGNMGNPQPRGSLMNRRYAPEIPSQELSDAITADLENHSRGRGNARGSRGGRQPVAQPSQRTTTSSLTGGSANQIPTIQTGDEVEAFQPRRSARDRRPANYTQPRLSFGGAFGGNSTGGKTGSGFPKVRFDMSQIEGGEYVRPQSTVKKVKPFKEVDWVPKREPTRILEEAKKLIKDKKACPYCGENPWFFKEDPEWYQQHLDQHKYEFACCEDRCAGGRRMFANAEKYRHHQEEQHDPKLLKGKLPKLSLWCRWCCMHFTSVEDWVKHMARRHPEKPANPSSDMPKPEEHEGRL